MLIICDFDGTVTTRDINSHLARRFAPEAYAAVEGQLATRALTLREVLDAEFRGIRAERDEVVAAALEIPIRPHFAAFLDAADAAGAQVVLLSSGFAQIIEPILEHAGLAGRVPLVSNDVVLGAEGGRITWRELPECELCGEPCKRHDVARLRAGELPGTAGAGAGGRAAFGQVAFVGDGFSDRCGAETADHVFARDNLATWLDSHGIAYEPWEDFDDVARVLGLPMATGPEPEAVR